MLNYLATWFGKDPATFAKTVTVIVYAHFFTLIFLFFGHLCFKRGRKNLRKYWRLSKEGPFYRLLSWIFWKYVSFVLWIDRLAFGERLVNPPTDCKPTFTIIKTQSDRIILNWTAERSSTWYSDKYELQVRSSGQAAGGEKASVEGWDLLYSGEGMKYDYGGLIADTPYHFRARAFNSKGESQWCAGTFETRQVPVEEGGKGLGYTWKQTSADIQLTIPCRPAARAKDIVVECRPTYLCVKDNGVTPPTVLVDGELSKSVKSSDVSWALQEEGGTKRLVVVMEKSEETNSRKEHWRNVIKTHACVDHRFLSKVMIPGRLEA
mmetsp:Transcript_40500/g.82771  ORF Transcript_40500/g.82771 Transcript_40500/m.82771 type:complete len:321 (+) Transcript_40500:270-1232(+)